MSSINALACKPTAKKTKTLRLFTSPLSQFKLKKSVKHIEQIYDADFLGETATPGPSGAYGSYAGAMFKSRKESDNLANSPYFSIFYNVPLSGKQVECMISRVDERDLKDIAAVLIRKEGVVLYSRHRHDCFPMLSPAGKVVGVDGGRDYLKVFGDLTVVEECRIDLTTATVYYRPGRKEYKRWTILGKLDFTEYRERMLA